MFGVLCSKRSQLLDLINSTVHNKETDLILLSETWLTPYSPTFTIPGYEFHHLDQPNKKGGGVGILSSSKLRCILRNDLTSRLSESECITIDITICNGKHCLVCSMYRPPNSDIPVFLASYSSLVCAMKKECPNDTIVGLDHNLDFLKACSHHQTNDFIQHNLDLGMIPTITRPTRITKSSATLIDNIIVSQNFCGKFIGSILVNDMSDHLPTVCIINSYTAVTRGTVTITSRDTQLKNLKALRAQLNNHDWSQELSDKFPSVNMEQVHNVLTSIVDSITYKDYNKSLRKIIRAAKHNYYHDKCAEFKSQTRKLWSLINEISGKKK